MTSLIHARANHDVKPGIKPGIAAGNNDCHAPLSDAEASVDGLHRIKTMANPIRFLPRLYGIRARPKQPPNWPRPMAST